MYFTNNAIAPYKRKRRLDRRARRYNDGIKDVGIQIKQKARELAGYFKQLPNSKKVVFVISQIGKIVGILLAKSARGEALTAEDKLLRDKLRKRIEDLKTFSEMRGFDASETINKKQEQLNSIESKDTRFKLKLFVSLVSTFASLIGDWFVLRTPKAEQLARRDNAIKRFGDISRDNARRVLFAIVTAAAGFALSKLINKIRDPKHANEIRAGILKESDYVKDFADNFLKKSSIIVPMNDPETAEYINESLNIVRNARTIDELLSVFPGNRELMNAKRLYSELKMTRDSALKRRIDKAVRKYIRMALKDAGVQGMKRGQHVKARDPEYVESLRNGGGAVNSGDGNQPKQSGMGIGKKIALGSGGAAALLGAGLLGHKLGVKRGALKMAKVARKKIREQKEANNQRVFNAIKNAVNG